MTTIRINAGVVLTFDGTVLECFYSAQSYRARVGTLHDVQIESDRKGKHWLHVNANRQPGVSLPGAQLLAFTDQVSSGE
jgi:hypothetical protein